MRLLFCGGGTGGHVSPAIAIAEYAKKHSEIEDFAFVGRLSGDENKAITKKGYKLYEIEISGFKREISLENLKKFIKLSSAIKKAKEIILEFKPDAVIGTGGYVCWPVIRCAQKMKIPTFIHESNAYPGLVTRLLSKKCDKVFLNVPEAKEKLKRQDNALIVGNPVSEKFYKTDRLYARSLLGIKKNELFICSYGGSGGAEKMNEVIMEFIKKYSSKNSNIKHIHASGKKYYEKIKENSPEFINGKNGVFIHPYIDDMHVVLNASDIVIARCGAMTLTELSASGAASILIPSPNVTNNHQYVNAKILADNKCAKLIEEKDLSSKVLIDTIDTLIKNPDERKELSKNIKAEFYKNSEQRILEEVLKSAL